MSFIYTRKEIAMTMKSNKVLSQRGSKNYFFPSDLLGAYPKPFSEEAGSILVVNCFDDLIVDNTILDLVENQNGTLNGNPIVSSESKFRESLKFDGSSGYINFGNNSIFNLTSQITLEVWLRLNSTSGTPGIFGKNSGVWYLRLHSSEYRFYINNGPVSTGVGVDTTNWHYIVGTYDGVNQKIYVDGAEKNSAAYSTPMNIDTENVYIGRFISSYLDGWVAGARLSNRAKTANEIHDYYYGLWGL